MLPCTKNWCYYSYFFVYLYMENKEKGLVYFFRHKGTTPVKVGFSLKEDYRDRFNTFNMYSPYGAEVLGVIMSESPQSLEKRIHQEVNHLRTRGEFFDITVDKVNELIAKYSNELQLKIMKSIADSVIKEFIPEIIEPDVNASKIRTEKYNKEIVCNLKNAIQLLGVEKNALKTFFKDNGIENKVFKIGVVQVRGFRFFIEENLYIEKKKTLNIYSI